MDVPLKPPAISTRWIHEKGAARPFQTPKELSKHKNASRFAKRIFCTSPVYGSADGVTFSQNFTFCKGVKSAAKQQMGETRKKCNSDDRRLRRIQGGAVGAAASRMRAVAKQTLGAATRRLPRLESSGCFSGSLLARKRELSLNEKALCPAHRRAKPFIRKPSLTARAI